MNRPVPTPPPRIDPLTVGCRRCGAEVGQPCEQHGRAKRQPHQARKFDCVEIPLAAAARASIAIDPDPNSGHRDADPLRDLIPGDGREHASPLLLMHVDRVIGGEGVRGHTVAEARAALRHWAHQQTNTTESKESDQ